MTLGDSAGHEDAKGLVGEAGLEDFQYGSEVQKLGSVDRRTDRGRSDNEEIGDIQSGGEVGASV